MSFPMSRCLVKKFEHCWRAQWAGQALPNEEMYGKEVWTLLEGPMSRLTGTAQWGGPVWWRSLSTAQGGGWTAQWAGAWLLKKWPNYRAPSAPYGAVKLKRRKRIFYIPLTLGNTYIQIGNLGFGKSLPLIQPPQYIFSILRPSFCAFWREWRHLFNANFCSRWHHITTAATNWCHTYIKYMAIYDLCCTGQSVPNMQQL